MFHFKGFELGFPKPVTKPAVIVKALKKKDVYKGQSLMKSQE